MRKAGGIAIGVGVVICLWAAVFGMSFLVASRVENSGYVGYLRFDTIEEAVEAQTYDKNVLLEGTGVYEREDLVSSLRLTAKNMVITGDYQIDQLDLECDKLIVKGSLTIEDLKTSCKELIIQGKLTANYLVFNGHGKEIVITNNGNLIAGSVSSWYRAVEFRNSGTAQIDGSAISIYTCIGEGKITVATQGKECIVNLTDFAAFYNNDKDSISFGSSMFPITVIYGLGSTVAFSVYKNENFERNPYIFLVLLFVVLGMLVAHIVSGIICSLVVRSRVRNKRGEWDTGFSGSIIIYNLFMIGFGLINGLTFGVFRPYLSQVYEKWKWKNTTIGGKQMEFIGKGDRIFFKNILWSVLGVFTLGIHTFWSEVKFRRWLVGGVKNESEQRNSFASTPFDMFRFWGLSLVKMLVIAGLYMFALLLIANVFKTPIAIIIGVLACVFVILTAFIYVVSDIYRHFADLTWAAMRVNGICLGSHYASFKKFLVFYLLTFITLGGYGYVIQYKLDSMLIKFS